MEMMGKVLEYSEKDSLGYIEGYDKRVYIFFKKDIKSETKLNSEDIVEFNFTRDYNDQNTLYALDIEKIL